MSISIYPFLPNSKNKGFNLIEAAIVLGVVGLVIGGIWAVASTVHENLKISETSSALIQMVQNARRIYGYNNFPVANGTSTDVTSSAIFSNVIPSTFISSGSAQSYWGAIKLLQSRWSGVVCCGKDSAVFEIYLYNLPRSVCLRLIPMITSNFKNREDLTWISISPASESIVYLSTFPVAPNQTGYCGTSASTADVRFFFFPIFSP